MAHQPILVWFRQDLRTADQPALRAAAETGRPVIPVFVWAPAEEGEWPPGRASGWWLHQSLLSLQENLRRLGSRLVMRVGPTLAALKQLISETGADAVYWNRRYEPVCIARDTELKAALRQGGTTAKSFNGSLLYEPWEIQTRTGTPYRVFTPFSRACLALRAPAEPLAEPEKLAAPREWPESCELPKLGLEPRIPWTAGMRAAWTPGSAGAAAELQRFLESAVRAYSTARDVPGERGTSRLSPYLHFGEISPRQIWHAVCQALREDPVAPVVAAPYLRQLLWREFAYHLLLHYPTTPTEPLRPEFADFPWEKHASHLKAWQRGQTGYPIVDAGMRELWTTGWMHNRVRMLVGSFLVKDLLIPWQEGARWFWDTLVDADLANNTLGWQWIAGCGADAAPYFRVFNPSGQGEKFDADGRYVRRWVPELANVPAKWIHRPWEAPSEVLQAAGVTLGGNYPQPLVDHADARLKALAALATLRES